jgi:hypothetical protein
LIKWNPRKENVDEWLDYAERKGRWESPREGKRIALFCLEHKRQCKGYEYRIRRVMRLTGRTIKLLSRSSCYWVWLPITCRIHRRI